MPSDKKRDIAVEDFYNAFSYNMAIFEKKLPQFIKDFPGEYVAMIKGEVIAHMSSWEDLTRFARRAYPGKHVFIERAMKKNDAVMHMDTIEG